MATETKKKATKKEFFEVKVPMTSAKVHLYGAAMEELDARVIRLDLTRHLRGKSFELRLRVKKMENELIGEPLGMELIGSYVRRMIRKGTDYVEDSFKAECRDAKVLIKPFLITRNKVSRAIRKELRNTGKKHLESHLK